jgi:hypothetical protein
MFGRRETVAMSIINFIDNYRRDVQFYSKWIFNKDLRNEMSKNKALKDSHKGKRCFIVGNGPSLKHYDLSKLSDEYVFTVNNMMSTDSFKILKPNFHLFFDPEFFNFFFHLHPKNDEEKSKMNLIRTSLELYPKMICFSSYRLKSTSAKLFPKLNAHYLFNNKIFSPNLKKSATLNRNTPAFQNVILYAINIAIYMGFDEIYLLGVDMTGFLEHYEFNKRNEKWGHFYVKSQEDQEKEIKFLSEKNIDNEFYLKTFGKTLEHLKLMLVNANKNNVKLLNASEHGAIDCIPRTDYNQLFTSTNAQSKTYFK